MDGALQDRLEMVEVLRQLVEAEILGDAVHAPGLRLRLEGADQQLAGVLLVVGAGVHVAQTGRVEGTPSIGSVTM